MVFKPYLTPKKRKRKSRSSGKRRKIHLPPFHHRLNCVTSNVSRFEHIAKTVVVSNRTNLIGMYVRSSSVWIWNRTSSPSDKFLKSAVGGTYSFPYIDTSGLITSHLLHRMTCEPQVVIASFFSTCFRRVWSMLQSLRDSVYVVRRTEMIAAIVAYHTCECNNYKLKRLISLMLSNPSCLRNVLMASVFSMPDRTKVLYCQVLKRAKWLSFRSGLRHCREGQFSAIPIFGNMLSKYGKANSDEIYSAAYYGAARISQMVNH
jgi:hypothetical protein